ncbi:MAG TPA: polysaccharide biosynthesis tyrosine autokinase [Parafilimonas sp.]
MQDVSNDFTTSAVRPHRDVDVKFLVAKVLGNWYWYVLSIILFLCIGFLIYLFTSPRYTVEARVLVTGYNAQGRAVTGTDETTVLSDLNINSVPNSVANEMEIIHSKTLIEKTVRDLQLNVSYWGQGEIRYEEIYKASPYFIQLLSLNNQMLMNNPMEYDVRVIGDKVKFEDEYTDSIFTAAFGDTLHFRYGTWVVERNPVITETNPKHQLGLIINSYSNAVYDYMDDIEASNITQYVNIIDLTISGTTPEKNEDMLGYLISLYVKSDIDSHNKIADSTIQFINSRLAGVSEDLTNIDKNIESFKKQNHLTDLTSDTKELLQNTSTTNQNLAEKQVEYKVVDDLENYLSDERNNTRIMPTTAPIQDPAFVKTLDKYNSLQLERQTDLQTSTAANPAIKSIDIQLSQLRGDLLSMMKTYKSSLGTEQADLENRNNEMMGNIYKVPTQERIYLDFTRQQNVIQNLYTYLLQTREQTAVSKSNNIGPIRIIDEPERGPLPWFPNLVIISIAAIFLGLLIPSITLFMQELLNNRVITIDDIANYTNAPVVASISHAKNTKQVLITKESRNQIAEQFKTLRTSLQFLMPDSSEKVLMTTSSMGGEGKSFTAINLATVLAISGKKVLLMEMDLRKPRISSALDVENSFGFSDYIVSDAKVADIIKPSRIHANCYLISSGTIPPNPAELLVHEKVTRLFDEVRQQFDYIIIDCPAVGLVTDALLLSKYTDMVLYMVRQRYTYKKQISIIQSLINDRRFKKIDIIFNDVKVMPGYGYNYGFGFKNKHSYKYYEQEERSFFKNIFSKNKRSSV